MKSSKLIIIFITLMFLTSCATMPKEVKEDTGNYNSNTKIENKNNLEYDSLEKIYNGIDDALAQKYQNLILPKKIIINKPESISVLTLKQVSDFDKNANEFWDMFYGNGEDNILNEEIK